MCKCVYWEIEILATDYAATLLKNMHTIPSAKKNNALLNLPLTIAEDLQRDKKLRIEV